MKNSKKKYMLKSAVIKVITNSVMILWMNFVIFPFYPQCMCKNSGILVDKKIDISEKTVNKNLDYLKIDIKVPVFINGKDESNVENINNISKDIINRAFKTENEIKEEFNNKETLLFPYEIKSVYTVTEKNDNIISLYNDYYEYFGGAHGSTIRNGYTIDRNNEKIIGLKDLFLDNYDYKDIINNKIREEIGKNTNDYFYTSESFKGISDEQGFYINNGDIVVFFNQYEIAPYVAGIPEFKIPIKEFGTNFKYLAT
ncbi:MAG: DUF3298 and DUF4163 domain-containing protein [Clostridium butyricum]|nr:DUF3298 and DUF4163 domain-containing protein [Clostridium butyricum]